jgi:hypothetical protein
VTSACRRSGYVPIGGVEGPIQWEDVLDVAGPEGRRAHLDGRIAAALVARADELLASPPDIQPIDVLAAKLP